MRWLVPLVAGAVGLAVGLAVGGGDPTASAEYRELEDELAAAEDERDEAEGKVTEAEQTARQALADVADRELAADEREGELDGRAAELDAQAAALDGREAAVAGAEAAVAATQIKDGIWTVGVDIEPGTYRVASELTGYCYWAILRSGTNGDDIIENDGPEGGFPVVTLSEGQDFENSCGLWNKQ